MISKYREIREKMIKYIKKKYKNIKYFMNLIFTSHMDISYKFTFFFMKIILMSLYMDSDTFISSSDYKSGAWLSW